MFRLEGEFTLFIDGQPPRVVKKGESYKVPLAEQARKIAGHYDVLYHGTRYHSSILNTGILCRPLVGYRAVSLTRSTEVAAHFALLERDDDEGRGAILIFDRQSLCRRYRLERFQDPGRFLDDEMEERVRDNITDIDTHLVGFAETPHVPCSQGQRQANRRHNLRLSKQHDEIRNRLCAESRDLAFSQEIAECERLDREELERCRQLIARLGSETI